MTDIIGISAYYHDSAVAFIRNGKIIYASQEERFSRIKHDSSFPKLAFTDLLNYCNLKISDIEAIVFYDKPFLKFERLIESYLAFAPEGFKQFLVAMPIWIKEKLFMKNLLHEEIKKFDKNFSESKFFFSEHHMSHAASAFYPSPFKDALILTADGVGEWTTTSIARGLKNNIEILKEIHFPHSVGLLYSAFTYYLGFKVNSGEYKVMGLAPYGDPVYVDLIKNNLVDIKNDGSFRLNQKYFEYAKGFKMINQKFMNLFKKKNRLSESKIDKFHMDIAASIQKVTEEIIIKIVKNMKEEYGGSNLCMAGGVALNCVINGILKKKKIFKNIWIQPASGDAGGAIGAALAYWYNQKRNKRRVTSNDQMQGSFLGPSFSNHDTKKQLELVGAKFKKVSKRKLISDIPKYISNGQSVGWFQGRMEFGPRALGNRSILADPRNKNMQKNLNLKIKYRESFRPFAPAILDKDQSSWLELKEPSPYMLLVSMIKREKRILSKVQNGCLKVINEIRSKIPAITHVDYSARIQTVQNSTNALFYELINSFGKLTGVPLLINTSFNIRGEPIVCSPEDAFRCFMGTNLDILVIENFILKKTEQNKNLLNSYKDKFKLD